MSCRGAIVRFAVPAHSRPACVPSPPMATTTPSRCCSPPSTSCSRVGPARRDLVVATPVANRIHPAQMEALGLFVNTVALRTPPRSARRAVHGFARCADRADDGSVAASGAALRPAARGARRAPRPEPTAADARHVHPAERAATSSGFTAPGLRAERLPLDTGHGQVRPHAVPGAARPSARRRFRICGRPVPARHGRIPRRGLSRTPTRDRPGPRPAPRGTRRNDDFGGTEPDAGDRSTGMRPPRPTLPRNGEHPQDMQALVASIWCEILERDAVSPELTTSISAGPRSA